METFLKSRDGRHLRELASALASLCNRKGIRELVQTLYHHFSPIKGLGGRDLEIWNGMFVLAQIIDSESPGLKLFDRLVKIAIATTEKREEDSFFLDWDIKYLIAVHNFFSTNPYDSFSYVQADKITKHVIEEINLPFPLRTETLGKLLDRESILISRKLCWYKVELKSMQVDRKGNSVHKEDREKPVREEKTVQSIHKTGWRIDVGKLKKRIAKFEKYVQPSEDKSITDEALDSVFADIAEKNYPDI